MRWLFLFLTLLSAGVAFSSDNPALMGVAFLLMILFAFIAVLAFAQARIEASAQSQVSILGGREVQELRRQAVQKRVATQTSGRTPADRGGAGYGGEFNAPSTGGRGGRSDQADYAGADGAGDGGGGD